MKNETYLFSLQDILVIRECIVYDWNNPKSCLVHDHKRKSFGCDLSNVQK